MIVADHKVFELCGVLDAIRWRDEESGATIGVLVDGTTVKGDAQEGELEEGIAYRFLGRWENHYRYGKQFAFSTLTQDRPGTEHGVVKYLEREAQHVGQAIARKLWAAYGPAAIEVLRTEPERVASDGIMAIDNARAASADLVRGAALEKTKVELFELFSGRGFSKAAVKACIEKWGANAGARIRRDPFILLIENVPSAGFRRCDKIYIGLGLNPNRIKRQMFAAWDAIASSDDGHTWHKEFEIKRHVMKCVGPEHARPEQALELGRRGGWFSVRMSDHNTKRWVADAKRAENEANVASCVRALISSDERILWPTEKLDASVLSEHQLEKTLALLKRHVAILAGPPGVGKTYVAAEIIRQVAKRWGDYCCAVCAPTGKAAVRITQAMGRYDIGLEATTIHRLLKVCRNGRDGKGWGFFFNRENKLPQKFYFLDESSMLDIDLAAAFFMALPRGAHVILIGDDNQLPPVGHGALLRDMIKSDLVPCAMLTEIQRNAGMIVRACTAIKNDLPFETCTRYEPDQGRNLQMVIAETPDHQIEQLQKIMAALMRSKKFDPKWDVQVLCAMNKKGEVNRGRLNALLQGMLNPPRSETARAGPEAAFRVGDKVICLRNCLVTQHSRDISAPADDVKSYRTDLSSGMPEPLFLANGEIGEVLAASPGVVVMEFPEKIVKIPMKAKKPSASDEDGAGGAVEGAGSESGTSASEGSGGDFALAYAITVHKSQGSEWPLVIVILDDAADIVTSREHIYTAISRASKHCILIGKHATIKRQCKRIKIAFRQTFLKELLDAAPDSGLLLENGKVS